MPYFPQVPNDLDEKLRFKRIDKRFCYYHEDHKMYVLKSYNTIVAMFIKKSNTLFYDLNAYSSYTGRHKGVFVTSIIEEKIGNIIYIPQTYLINFIRNTLDNKPIDIKIDMPFKVGEYVKLYRLHNLATKTAKVSMVSGRFDFVKGNNVDACTVTPTYYTVYIPNYTNKEYPQNIFCYTRNLRHLDKGI